MGVHRVLTLVLTPRQGKTRNVTLIDVLHTVLDVLLVLCRCLEEESCQQDEKGSDDDYQVASRGGLQLVALSTRRFDQAQVGHDIVDAAHYVTI